MITHLHPDHCSDVGLVRNAIAYGGHRQGAPLRVFGPSGWAEWLAAALPDATATWRAFEVTELADGGWFDVGTLRVYARAVRHETPTFGCRVESPRGVLAYSADSAPCDSLIELARDAGVFLCEAFRSLPDAGPSDIVSTPEEAGSTATAAGARSLLLTHLHPEADPEAAIARALTTYAGPVEVATQGRRVSIQRHG